MSSNFFDSQTAAMAVNETRGGMGGEEDCSDRAVVKMRERFDSRCARWSSNNGLRTGG